MEWQYVWDNRHVNLNFCEQNVIEFQNMLNYFLILHAFSFVICLYREIYFVNVQRIGSLMRILEVIGLYGNLAVLVLALSLYSLWMSDFSIEMYKRYMNIGSYSHHSQKVLDFMQPRCLRDHTLIQQWGGGVLSWIQCQITIHVSYMFTFIILMAKSRVGPVGADHTQQF